MAIYNPVNVEKEILSFWEEKKIFDKLVKKNNKGKKWSFLDGPITANNPMGVHHAWGRTYKDLFQRFKAMQGHKLRYQNGFDCQGLWVEREEEKDLGLESKKDIEKYGIKNFVEACKKRVKKFSEIQTKQSIRLGFWMDWNNSYYTNTDTNQLHNWHLLKEYHKKGLIYKGKDAVPWCWRCGTASSKHDIATEGYKEVTHKALFMQFPIKNRDNEYLLIFTTTPWTIPANVAVAANKEVTYALVDNEGVKYWIAEKRLEEIEGNYEVLEKKKGKELEGIEYLMPYSSLEMQNKSPHKVVLWDLASEEEGTGFVHIAPGCGKEDYDLGKELGFPAPSPLDESGVYHEGWSEFSLKKYSQVNKEVIEDLEQRRFIYKTVSLKHRYPHCWRCSEELVFRLVDEWYVKCTEEFREKVKSENEKVVWYPEYGKIRQNDWFDKMGDWMISQKRYYGQPLPIWECECGNFEVIGSLKELKEKTFTKEEAKKVDNLVSIHRPYIDEITIKCPKCNKQVKRIPDLGMAWLDAGIVGFSTIGPYLENKEYWKQWYPADFITENMPGQYRGWFNALFWASVMLTGKSCFKKLFGYESLKDEKGEEMHKSKGNAIWFDDAVEKVGADPMRLLYCLQDPSQELRFGYNVLKEPRNNLNILYNMSNLITNSKSKKYKKIEDLWIISKFNSLIKNSSKEIEEMHPHQYSRLIQNFWLNDLSRGYIQLVRDRLSEDDPEVKSLLNEIYVNLMKLCAPMIPFLTETIWQELRKKKVVSEESVHLCDWPKAEEKLINKELEDKFDLIFKIIESGLAVRDKEKIGLKWPLQKATIIINDKQLGEKGIKEIQEIIMKQLNVKSTELKFTVENKAPEVTLDTKTNPELEAEGYSREISRNVQSERKKAGFVKTDLIKLKVVVPKDLFGEMKHFESFIKERTNSKELKMISEERALPEDKRLTAFEIKGKKFSIEFTK